MRLPPEGVARKFSTARACRARLRVVRWPEGVRCPKCNGGNVASVAGRKTFSCRNCRYQFSVTTGTILHGSNLPLPGWFAVAEHIIQTLDPSAYNPPPAAEALRKPAKSSYATAFRIRKLLLEDLSREDAGLVGRCICIGPIPTDRELTMFDRYAR